MSRDDLQYCAPWAERTIGSVPASHSEDISRVAYNDAATQLLSHSDSLPFLPCIAGLQRDENGSVFTMRTTSSTYIRVAGGL